MISIQVISSDKEEKEKWQKYVDQNPQATFFHLIEWQEILKKVYGYEPFYLAAVQADQIKGILPLFQINSLIRGKNLASLPFHFLGGPLGDSPEIEQNLIDYSIKLAKKLGCHNLRIKSCHSYPEPLQLNQSYLSFKVPLKENFEETAKQFAETTRRNIRSGLRNNRIDLVENLDQLKSFYTLFIKSTQRIGIPPHSFQLFKELWEKFGPEQKFRITLAACRDFYVAGHVALNFKGSVLYMWGALDRTCKSKGFQALQGEAMNWAIKNGYQFYDLGWTHPQEAGALHYKRHFGAQESPVHFYSLVAKNKLDYHRSFPLAKAIWRKLPLPLIKIVSPWLAKQAG